ADISPVAHISSTIAAVSVRNLSDSVASACTRSRIPRASETTRSSVSAIDVIGPIPIIDYGATASAGTLIPVTVPMNSIATVVVVVLGLHIITKFALFALPYRRRRALLDKQYGDKPSATTTSGLVLMAF